MFWLAGSGELSLGAVWRASFGGYSASSYRRRFRREASGSLRSAIALLLLSMERPSGWINQQFSWAHRLPYLQRVVEGLAASRTELRYEEPGAGISLDWCWKESPKVGFHCVCPCSTPEKGRLPIGIIICPWHWLSIICSAWWANAVWWSQNCWSWPHCMASCSRFWFGPMVNTTAKSNLGTSRSWSHEAAVQDLFYLPTWEKRIRFVQFQCDMEEGKKLDAGYPERPRSGFRQATSRCVYRHTCTNASYQVRHLWWCDKRIQRPSLAAAFLSSLFFQWSASYCQSRLASCQGWWSARRRQGWLLVSYCPGWWSAGYGQGWWSASPGSRLIVC